MTPSWWTEAERDADELLDAFTQKVRAKLNVPSRQIVRRKNPYLYAARGINRVDELADALVAAYISSSEETMFGNVLEEMAIAVCSRALGGRKSGIENIDLEYDRGATRTLVQIKSGPNWGNASQKRALQERFASATRTLKQGSAALEVRCVEGICYGPSSTRHTGTHWRIVGRNFWKEVSDWTGTADAVMDLLADHATNSLTEPRREAQRHLAAYLRDEGVADRDGTVKWSALLDLVMG